MGVFATFLATFFGYVAEFLMQRLTVGVAAASAFLITAAAGYLGFKSAIMALSAGLAVVLPPSTYALLSYCIPTNIYACITAILVGDAASAAWDYWHGNLHTAMALAKA